MKLEAVCLSCMLICMHFPLQHNNAFTHKLTWNENKFISILVNHGKERRSDRFVTFPCVFMFTQTLTHQTFLAAYHWHLLEEIELQRFRREKNKISFWWCYFFCWVCCLLFHHHLHPFSPSLGCSQGDDDGDTHGEDDNNGSHFLPDFGQKNI